MFGICKKLVGRFVFVSLFPLLAMFVNCGFVFAQDTNEQIYNKIKPEVDALVERILNEFDNHDYATLEELSNFEQQFVNNGYEKFQTIFSHKLFDELQKHEIEKLKIRSKQTGRKIMTYPDNIDIDNPDKLSEVYIWLDEGGDLESCRGKFNAIDCRNDYSFECYKNEGNAFCEYPDGFEKYTIVLKNNKDSISKFKELVVIADNKDINKSRIITLDLLHNSEVSNDEDYLSLFLILEDDIMKYTEEADWRNRHNKAQKNGGWLWGTWCNWYPDDYKCKDIVNKDYEDFFPNRNNMMPAVDVFSYISDYSRLSQKKQKNHMVDPFMQTKMEKRGFEFDENGKWKRLQNGTDRQAIKTVVDNMKQNNKLLDSVNRQMTSIKKDFNINNNNQFNNSVLKQIEKPIGIDPINKIGGGFNKIGF